MTPADLPDWASALHDLADNISVAIRPPTLWTVESGPYFDDQGIIVVERREWGDEAVPVLRKAIWDCGRFVSTSIRHTHAIADLVAGGEVFVSIWPLVRAQLELGGRLAWVTDVGNGGINIGPSRRCARWFMEQLTSACYQTAALKALKSRHLNDARKRRQKGFAEIERLFGVQLSKWEGPGSESEWAIGDDRYMSLASSCELFAKRLNPQMRGLYPALSGFSHPSVDFLAESISDVDKDGHRWAMWRVEPPIVLRHVMWSGSLMYRTATGLVSYLDSDPEGHQQGLEEAMDRFEQSLPSLGGSEPMS